MHQSFETPNPHPRPTPAPPYSGLSAGAIPFFMQVKASEFEVSGPGR